MNLKLIVRTAFSLEAIYQLRKAPVKITLLMSLLIGILHFTPHTLSFLGLSPYVRHLEQMWQLTTDDERQQLMETLPSVCTIYNLQLSCDDVMTYHIGNDFGILVNHDDVYLENGLVLMPDHLQVAIQGNTEEFSYHYFEGLNFEILQGHSQGYEIFMNRFAQAIRGVLILPFIVGSYLTGIVSFAAYIVGVSSLSMLLKFGHTSFLNYKEVLNIMVFSSVLPTTVVIIIGFITPVFTTLIFNFTTPILAYFVYKKYVISGLQNTTNEIKKRF